MIGTTRRLGPASIITAFSPAMPQRSATEFGLARMGEADLIELRLGNRPGHQRARRAGPRQPGGDLERMQRTACAVTSGMPGVISPPSSTLSTGSAPANAGLASAGSEIRAIGRPHRGDRAGIPDRKEGGQAARLRGAAQALAMTSGPIRPDRPWRSRAARSSRDASLNDIRSPHRDEDRAARPGRAG